MDKTLNVECTTLCFGVFIEKNQKLVGPHRGKITDDRKIYILLEQREKNRVSLALLLVSLSLFI